jgi:mono/diheme cytochrome c family protein
MINFLTGILLLPGWLATASHEAPHPDLEMGKRIYQERCKVCHGSQGDGKSFAANALNPPPKNFTSPESKKQLNQKRMLKSATNGRPGTAMMPWKDVLTAEEIRAVVHYIRKELMRVD